MNRNRNARDHGKTRSAGELGPRGGLGELRAGRGKYEQKRNTSQPNGAHSLSALCEGSRLWRLSRLRLS